jgi:hypothetical protein
VYYLAQVSSMRVMCFLLLCCYGGRLVVKWMLQEVELQDKTEVRCPLGETVIVLAVNCKDPYDVVTWGIPVNL